MAMWMYTARNNSISRIFLVINTKMLLQFHLFTFLLFSSPLYYFFAVSVNETLIVSIIVNEMKTYLQIDFSSSHIWKMQLSSCIMH